VTEPPTLPVLLRELAERTRHDPLDEYVRLAVRLRARDACEYCLLPTTGAFHVDHIIPPALWSSYVAGWLAPVRYRPGRVGPDHLDNFAWCRPFCNIAKRQCVAHHLGRRAYRLFDPRFDRWPEDFVFVHNNLFIVGLPGIGQATEKALGFNDQRLSGPLGTCHDAILVGRYPPVWARAWLVSGELWGCASVRSPWDTTSAKWEHPPASSRPDARPAHRVEFVLDLLEQSANFRRTIVLFSCPSRATRYCPLPRPALRVRIV
jgi:hypothetical protein